MVLDGADANADADADADADGAGTRRRARSFQAQRRNRYPPSPPSPSGKLFKATGIHHGAGICGPGLLAGPFFRTPRAQGTYVVKRSQVN